MSNHDTHDKSIPDPAKSTRPPAIERPAGKPATAHTNDHGKTGSKGDNRADPRPDAKPAVKPPLPATAAALDGSSRPATGGQR